MADTLWGFKEQWNHRILKHVSLKGCFIAGMKLLDFRIDCALNSQTAPTFLGGGLDKVDVKLITLPIYIKVMGWELTLN